MQYGFEQRKLHNKMQCSEKIHKRIIDIGK
jgi:hypothetical protein